MTRERRILHLVLPRLATDRLARERSRAGLAREGKTGGTGHTAEPPRATVRKSHGASVLDAVDERAAAAGLQPGQGLADARAMVPALLVDPADPEADAAALAAIARAADRYTPLVALTPPDGLFLDITGCAHLFGGEAGLVEDLLARLSRAGYTGAVAVADRPAVAWALARYGGGTSAVAAEGRPSNNIAADGSAASGEVAGGPKSHSRASVVPGQQPTTAPSSGAAQHPGARQTVANPAAGSSGATSPGHGPDQDDSARWPVGSPAPLDRTAGERGAGGGGSGEPGRAPLAGERHRCASAGGVEGETGRWCVPSGDEIAAVAPLPVAALQLPEEMVQVLHRVGLKTVGDVLRQPRAPLVHRFGPLLARRIDAVEGHISEPITPLAPVAPVMAERRFAEPVVDVEPLAAALGALGEEIARLLVRRGEGALTLRLRLFEANGEVRETAVGASEPVAEAERMRTLLIPRLRLLAERIDTDGGIDIVRLHADETAPLAPRQVSFDGVEQMAADLARLIDTLCERLGGDAVRRFVPVDTHDPVRAGLTRPAREVGLPAPGASPWRVARPVGPAGAGESRSRAASGTGPLRPAGGAPPEASEGAAPVPRPPLDQIAGGERALHPEGSMSAAAEARQGATGQAPRPDRWPDPPASPPPTAPSVVAGAPGACPSSAVAGMPGSSDGGGTARPMAPFAAGAEAFTAAPAPGPGWLMPMWAAERPPERPLRLFTPPEPVETVAGVPDGPPIRFRWRRVAYLVAAAEGPERIAPAWWEEGGETADYFRVEDVEGRRFWMFRHGLYGETALPRWFVHGLFA
jgi:nucleotidyltransferase/DNA polymerase involved in DNA repair